MADGDSFKYNIKVLDGGMALSVTLLFVPRMASPDSLTQQLIEDLGKRKVVFGLDQNVTQDLIRRRTLGSETVVARGVPVRRGSDAEIEMLKLPPSFLPTAGPDGKVDFRNIENIAQVAAGEVISRKIPIDEGEAGTNIFGMKLAPPKVKDANHPAGQNCAISEDGLEMSAAIDGYLRWNASKIDVVDLYVVNGDVDFNTGNIRYQGSIEVRGSVRAGFEVVAGRDATIVGMVDGGMVVSENGSVSVGQGVIGNSEAMGVVIATGDVKIGRARFAKIESKAGSIAASYAVEHSELKAAGDLTLNAGPAVACVIDVGGEVNVSDVSEHEAHETERASSNASQRRQFVRVQLLPALDVDIKRQNPATTIQAKLVDISAGGCRVRTQVRFKAGEEFQLQFRLPEVEGMVWMDAQILRAVDSPAERLDSRITYAVKYHEVEKSVRESLAKFCQAEDFRQNRLLRNAGVTPEAQVAMARRLGEDAKS
ncbi:MAG: DUF342 domain-containing protein [Chloroflexota bacterium]|nr:DUF342 domain-containing protein [Chloroflexota bacterium]